MRTARSSWRRCSGLLGILSLQLMWFVLSSKGQTSDDEQRVTGTITPTPSRITVCTAPRGVCQDLLDNNVFSLPRDNAYAVIVDPNLALGDKQEQADPFLFKIPGDVNLDLRFPNGVQTELISSCPTKPAILGTLGLDLPAGSVTEAVRGGILIRHDKDFLLLSSQKGNSIPAATWRSDVQSMSLAPIRYDTMDPFLRGSIDLRMKTLSGGEYRYLRGSSHIATVGVAGLGVEATYEDVSPESAEYFDRILNTMCAGVRNEVTSRNTNPNLGLTGKQVKARALAHPIMQWNSILYPHDKEAPLSLVEIELLKQRLTAEIIQLRGQVLFFNPWIAAHIDMTLSASVPTINIVNDEHAPIAQSRQLGSADSYAIDINLPVLRSLFRASNDGSTESSFVDFRNIINKMDTEDRGLAGLVARTHGGVSKWQELDAIVESLDHIGLRFDEAREFVLLHELGHIFLGHFVRYKDKLNDCSYRAALEADADSFSTAILTLRDPFASSYTHLNGRANFSTESPMTDFFTWAYDLSGFGNMGGAACGYPAPEVRLQTTLQFSNSIRRGDW